jgi:ubiquinone/menaquinone biosynthesis C-methylase UbiE
MATNYDLIARDYQRSKQFPWRLHVEQFTLFERIGNLAGKDVLDLACGEGFYTRQIKRAGAARVVGVDLSAGMIELARAEEARQPLGIEYIVQDARTVDLGPFDLVVAAYLLNYASTRDELLAMCQAIARNLKPGCRFVTVNSNPDFSVADSKALRKYGQEKIGPAVQEEGTPYNWRFHLEDRSFEITNYYLSVATHEWALRTAGFEAIAWHKPRLSPAGAAQYGKDYWRDYLAHPSMVFIEAVKRGEPGA